MNGEGLEDILGKYETPGLKCDLDAETVESEETIPVGEASDITLYNILHERIEKLTRRVDMLERLQIPAPDRP